MSDTFGPSFFFANNPNISADMRKRIALQMLMSNKRAFPKTFGEGLASIGDSIGDMVAMRRLGEIDAAENRAGDAAVQKYMTPGGPQTYAPPDGVPPAVAAINRAAGPAIAPAQPPPPPRVIVPPPQAPGGGAAPVAAGPDRMVNPEDYNEIDAADPRNRYRPPPAYLAPALERNIADPERRAYLGQLAGKEARSANEVSPTGAAGPFQFTRGTGAQYGIPGNARFDPDASTLAVNRFTDDNVKALTARLGREPTPGEMALAHQQGAGTAGNMLTGAGNASANNLAVNNVPPGMGPQAAAQRVMNYYAMPGATGVPASPRDAVAETLVAQAQPPQERPSVADYGQRLALAATPPDAGIRAAPPAASPIQAAPSPQQVAQAQPPAQSLVPPLPPDERPPPTMTPVQQNMLRDIQATPPSQREAVQKALKPLWDQEQAKVAQAQKEWDDKRAVRRQLEVEQYKLTAGAPKTKAEIDEINQRIEAGKLQEVSGKLVRNPDGSYSPPRITGVDQNAAPDVKLNESQTKALTYHDWASIGNEVVKSNEKVLAEGGAQAALGKVPFAGNALLNAKYRKAQAGANQFVNAFMRATSGGAYGEAEAEREAKALLPKPSDDPQTLELKRTQRDAFVKNLYGGLGEGKKLADFYGKERKEKQQQKYEKLNSEMEGKDKGKTYEKNGVFRQWVGDHWEEH